MDAMIGLDLGQRREPSALCVVQVQERWGLRDRRVDHFLVRHLERLPMGSTFPAVARRTAEVVAEVRRRSDDCPCFFVDATGLGDPVVDLFKVEIPDVWVRPVYFTHGDQRNAEDGNIRLGKAWLVARLQTLLQTGQLHLPRTPEAETLARDLLDFEIQVTEDANERYGAFRVGRHDDLITALGLAVQQAPGRWELFTVDM